MSQVIIVSNRLPVSVKKVDGELEFYPSVGGLATGLVSYVDDDRNSWIGWPGIASDELTKVDRQTIVDELAKKNCVPVFLSKRQIDDFYSGYSNGVLWPIFHNLPYKPKAVAVQKRWWKAYRGVNQEYAEAILNASQSGGKIWIHDYQLLLVPEMIRAVRLDVTIGFFLHIPFPAPKTFMRLPEYKKLLYGMLGADVVGFHTQGYVTQFVDTSQLARLGVATDNQLMIGNRVIRVGDFPMGIDYEKYAKSNKSKLVKAAIAKYRRRYKGRKVIVAVDRLDPSKGLVERVQAYETFLARHPRARGKVVFSLVAAPSRTDVPAYQKLAVKLGEAVELVNGLYSTKKWQPIDYINVSIPFEEVTALFQLADVAFIAPLRDGMNLAAKEFVASAHNHGVLILSETAGAAEQLQDAIIVNPRKPETLVTGLEQALTMRRGELQRRLKRMQQQLAANTVHDWARDFVGTLQQPVPGTPSLTRSLRGRLQLTLAAEFRSSKKRLLLLDYDGSLVPFAENYNNAKPPKSLLGLLDKLAADPRNDLVVISGRSAYDLDAYFGALPISLVAEHGAAVKKAGNKHWQTIERIDNAWKQKLLPVFEKYAALTPGAHVETKPHSLVWHYRGAQPYYAQKYAVVLKKALKPLLRKYHLAILQGNKVLEVKNPVISKGSAAQRWLKKPYDCVIAFGDDVTDEELFVVLPFNAYSIKVGRGRTAARYRVATHKDVLSLLRTLSKV